MSDDAVQLLSKLRGATLWEVRYDLANPRKKTAYVTLKCPPQCAVDDGLDWSDRVLLIIARGVILIEYAGWGGEVIGYEELDGWTRGLTPAADRRLREKLKPGEPLPDVRCTATFRSGGTLGLACDGIEVHVES